MANSDRSPGWSSTNESFNTVEVCTDRNRGLAFRSAITGAATCEGGGTSRLHVTTLILDASLTAYYERAVAPRARTLWCATRNELVVAARSVSAEGVVLLSACDEARAPLVSVMGDLRRVRPEFPVALLVNLDPDNMRALVALSRGGNVDVIVAGHDDAMAVLLQCAAKQRTFAAWERIRARFEAHLEPTALRIVRQCVMMGRRRSSVAELARRACVSRRTIANHLHAGALPTASELLAWGRVLAATSELETATSIEAVALNLGFGSAAALQNVCRRYLGMPASHVRCAGRDRIADRFADRVLSYRRGRDTASSQEKAAAQLVIEFPMA